jgi:hypothetical protein
MTETDKVQLLLSKKSELIQDAINNQKSIERTLAEYFPQYARVDKEYESELEIEITNMIDKKIVNAIIRDLEISMS